MDESTKERIAAFETQMNVSPSALAREEIIKGKRWTLLEAVGFLACGEDAVVDQVREWCPPLNALPHHRAADATSIHLTRDLDAKQARDPECLSFEGAVRVLLEALKEGAVMAYVDATPTSLAGLTFRNLVYSSHKIGLSPTPPGDLRYWESVYVNASDVRRLRRDRIVQPAVSRPIVSTGAKRGPKPKYDWFGLMGELVRIADQDGLDSIGLQADVERWALDWLTTKGGGDESPSESTVREHIAPIFQAIDRYNASKQAK